MNIPKGWDIEVAEKYDESWLIITHEDGSGAAFSCKIGEARDTVARRFVEELKTAAPPPPASEGETPTPETNAAKVIPERFAPTPETDKAEIRFKLSAGPHDTGIPIDGRWVHADFARSLERQRNELRERQWISVKERLPEFVGRDNSPIPGMEKAPATLHSARVLVFDGTVRIDNLVQAEGSQETATFYLGTQKPVTYWMPIPLPPQDSADG